MALQFRKLVASNYKRLRDIVITPQGRITYLVGPNEAGKSSICELVWAILGGAGASPGMPIRAGQTKASGEIDLGDIIATRKWSAASGTSLSVTNAEGVEMPGGPQSVINELVGKGMLDPLAFSRMKPAEQAKVLAEMAGVDLVAYARKKETLAAARTEANRKADEASETLKRLPAVEAPDEEVSVDGLMAELKAAQTNNQKIETAKQNHTSVMEEIRRRQSDIERTEAEILALQVKLAGFRDRKENGEAAALASQANIDAMTAVDVAPIEVRIRESSAVNKAVAAKKARSTAKAANDAASKNAEAAKVALKQHEEGFKKAIAEAKLPVQGLTFSPEGVSYKGIPLEQASTAETIRIGMSIGFARKPKLPLVIIREGSLLDADSREIIADILEENNALALIEVVEYDSKQVGIHIEEGEIVSIVPEPEPEPKA